MAQLKRTNLEVVASVASGNCCLLHLHPIQHVEAIDMRVATFGRAIPKRSFNSIVILTKVGKGGGKEGSYFAVSMATIG